MINLFYSIGLIVGAAAGGSDHNYEDNQRKNRPLAPAIKCIVCKTICKYQDVFVSHVPNTESVNFGNSAYVIQQIIHDRVLSCPNINCNCSLGTHKGVYILNGGTIEATREELGDLTDLELGKIIIEVESESSSDPESLFDYLSDTDDTDDNEENQEIVKD